MMQLKLGWYGGGEFLDSINGIGFRQKYKKTHISFFVKWMSGSWSHTGSLQTECKYPSEENYLKTGIWL